MNWRASSTCFRSERLGLPLRAAPSQPRIHPANERERSDRQAAHDERATLPTSRWRGPATRRRSMRPRRMVPRSRGVGPKGAPLGRMYLGRPASYRPTSWQAGQRLTETRRISVRRTEVPWAEAEGVGPVVDPLRDTAANGASGISLVYRLVDEPHPPGKAGSGWLVRPGDRVVDPLGSTAVEPLFFLKIRSALSLTDRVASLHGITASKCALTRHRGGLVCRGTCTASDGH